METAILILSVINTAAFVIGVTVFAKIATAASNLKKMMGGKR